jgi:hypothetical protein
MRGTRWSFSLFLIKGRVVASSRVTKLGFATFFLPTSMDLGHREAKVLERINPKR